MPVARIKESFLLVNNASRELQKSACILNTTKSTIGFKGLYEEYLTLLESLKSMLEQSKEISRLWSQENYLTLDIIYKDMLINQSAKLYETSNNLLNSTITSINRQNSLISEYNSLKDYLLQISKQQEQYVYYSDLKENITTDFNKIYDYLESVDSNLSKRKYASLSEFERELGNILILLNEFNQTVNQIYEQIVRIGKNISSFEYSKKCYLGYCESITDDVCADLDKITAEYKENTYSLPLNASISGMDYYIKVDGNITIMISNESEGYYKRYCLNLTENLSIFPTNIPDIQELTLPDTSNISTEDPIKNELTENPPMCCVYGKCSPCCASEECSSNPELFPIVFVHGHSMLKKTSPEPLLDGFNKIQYQLQEDGYINAGTIYFNFNESDYKKNEWGLSGFPITLKASYYYDYYYSLGKYIYLTQSTDNLDTYAVRLNDLINLIKYRTGKPKINIIAHSMGGLVARRYIQIFGEDSVDKIILIATPNKGIEGDVKKFCRVFGEKRECEDMYDDSIFLKKLNSQNYEPKNLQFYTISGIGCKTSGKDGDGVVVFESSTLDYAVSSVISGTCDSLLKKNVLHSELLNIDKYPEVYESIKEILS